MLLLYRCSSEVTFSLYTFLFWEHASSRLWGIIGWWAEKWRQRPLGFGTSRREADEGGNVDCWKGNLALVRRKANALERTAVT